VAPLAMRIDPPGAYNFLVVLVPSAGASLPAFALAAAGGFSECSGLEATLQIEEYREGGWNRGLRRFPSGAAWTNLRLRRGIAFTDDLWSWYAGFVEGRGTRRDGIVFLRNDLRVPVKGWRFTRGLPVRWTGPALNAAQSGIAVEELEIAHEGLELVPLSPPIGGVA
jgi:phage tail-like protein